MKTLPAKMIDEARWHPLSTPKWKWKNVLHLCEIPHRKLNLGSCIKSSPSEPLRTFSLSDFKAKPGQLNNCKGGWFIELSSFTSAWILIVFSQRQTKVHELELCRSVLKAVAYKTPHNIEEKSNFLMSEDIEMF